MTGEAAVRIDRWLHATRVFKTRSIAADACGGGKVLINGAHAKPATKVKVGDVVSARKGDREIVYEVTGLIEKRVSATVAAEHYIDRSPPPPERAPRTSVRDRGAGRPTKRDRREINRLRGRD